MLRGRDNNKIKVISYTLNEHLAKPFPVVEKSQVREIAAIRFSHKKTAQVSALLVNENLATFYVNTYPLNLAPSYQPKARFLVNTKVSCSIL